jgi:hypothetical protein
MTTVNRPGFGKILVNSKLLPQQPDVDMTGLNLNLNSACYICRNPSGNTLHVFINSERPELNELTGEWESNIKPAVTLQSSPRLEDFRTDQPYQIQTNFTVL